MVAYRKENRILRGRHSRAAVAGCARALKDGLPVLLQVCKWRIRFGEWRSPVSNRVGEGAHAIVAE